MFTTLPWKMITVTGCIKGDYPQIVIPYIKSNIKHNCLQENCRILQKEISNGLNAS